jgi:hypothetical protein
MASAHGFAQQSHEHLDENGAVVAKYEVRDSSSIYPTFGRSVSHRKID